MLSNSAKIHPRLQTSTAVVYGWIKISSGARYHLVTTCFVSCLVRGNFFTKSLCTIESKMFVSRCKEKSILVVNKNTNLSQWTQFRSRQLTDTILFLSGGVSRGARDNISSLTEQDRPKVLFGDISPSVGADEPSLLLGTLLRATETSSTIRANPKSQI